MIARLVSWWLAMGSAQVGIATRFSAHDVDNPQPMLACAHRPRRNLDDKRDIVVAMRDLPCRSKVLVCLERNGRCLVARVMDRGPFGKTKGKYTALVDLSLRASKKLRHNGFEKAFVAPLGR